MATGLARLQFMVGDWHIQAYQMTESGEWQEVPIPNQTKIDSFYDGAFIREEVVPMQLGDITVRFFIMWSYDKYREVYRMIACDDRDGLMDILEGNYIGASDTIAVSNVNTNTAAPDENGQHAYLRLSSTKNSEDSFTDEVHESSDGGKTWLPIYRAVHTRKS